MTGLSQTYAGQCLGAEQAGPGPVLEPVMTYRVNLPGGSDPAAVLPKLRLLEEEEPGRVITLLLEQQAQTLHCEIAQQQAKLEKVEALQRQAKQQEQFSVESIGDIARLMEKRQQLKRVHGILLLTGIPMSLLEVTGIVLWIAMGIWWPCVLYLLLSVPYGIWGSRYYFRRVAYICPQCHAVFRPKFKEAFFARHTPSARKLTCTCCGYHGFCVETVGDDAI